MATELATANEASFDVSSDSAEPSTALDNPGNLDYEEPEDEQAAPPGEETGTDPDRETDEPVEDGQEADATADDDEAEASQETVSVKDDAVVEVLGEKLPISELKSGYMRDRDYRHKTQELGNKRRDLEALTTRVTDSVNAIADLLLAQVPKAPDPSLAMTNPGQFVAEEAMHKAAMAQVNAVIEKATAPKEAANKLNEEQRSEYLQSENAKLAEAFPQTVKPEARKKFFDDAMSAASELGYTAQEIQGATDHRLFKLAHYARLGLAAEKARAKAAQKVVNVPPVAQQRRTQGVNTTKTRANQDAVKRLANSGSIHDAMAVDFD
jgi:hypothetical protein